MVTIMTIIIIIIIGVEIEKNNRNISIYLFSIVSSPTVSNARLIKATLVYIFKSRLYLNLAAYVLSLCSSANCWHNYL